MFLEWVFWVSFGLVAYAYFGYPLLLLGISRFRNRVIAEADYTPSVSLIMAVHNERATIRAKLDNLLSLEYPSDRLQIVIVSDCSTDGTDDIVSEYSDRGVTHYRLASRGGKHRAQREGIDHATGEILAFTDAAPILDSSALARMVRYFADPQVGCVSSEDRVMTDGRPSGEERSYIRYLMAVRRLETRLGSVVGLSGSFFAARRELCERWWIDRSSDFFMALEAVRRGLRAVHHADSIHYYRVTKSTRGEYLRKRRTVLNGLLVFFDSLDLLNPFRYGLFSLQLLSHKFLRWCVPTLLLIALLSSAVLAASSAFFAAVFAGQLIFYTLAVASLVIPAAGRFGPTRIAGFFCLGNVAAFMAWFDLVRGDTLTIWDPTQRTD